MHASSDFAPNMKLYVPAGQIPDGSDNPVALQIIPFGQGLHCDELALPSEKLPAGQKSHSVPLDMAYMPLEHLMH